MSWTVEYLNLAVLKEAEALVPDQRARLQRIIELVQVHGLERVREPHVKHLEGRLWEMRISRQGTIARAVYVTAIGKRVVIVRVFVKKTQKTPRREIELALKRGRGGDMRKRILAKDVHKKWLKDPAYREAYDSLAEEFALAAAVIEARSRAGLTQEELAERMGTTQPVVARLESGRIRPSTRTLERLAQATGSRLIIRFEPA